MRICRDIKGRQTKEIRVMFLLLTYINKPIYSLKVYLRKTGVNELISVAAVCCAAYDTVYDKAPLKLPDTHGKDFAPSHTCYNGHYLKAPMYKHEAMYKHSSH